MVTLGPQTYVINNEPDGTNINMNCGSTHIEVLQQYVMEKGLDVGFAFDGILTAIKMMEVILETKTPLSKLAEPVIRVMVEAQSDAICEQYVDDVITVIKAKEVR